MEEQLTIEELYLLVNAERKREERQNKFLAAIQGIDMAEEKDTSFEEVQARAKAHLAGKSEQQMTFDLIGISVESDDD